MKLTVREDINNLLKAQYKLLYLVTWEEERCKDMLHDLVEKVNSMDMFEWTLSGGLRQVGGDKPAIEMGPDEVLAHISKHESKALFMLKDFHSFLKDAAVTRALRDIVNSTVETYKPVVITSPVMQIPIELEKAVQVVDFDLPTAEQIEELVKGAQELITEKIGKEIDKGQKEKVIKACQGLTVDEIENILAKSYVEKSELSVKVILNEKKQIIRKSGVLEYYENLEEFANVGGMDSLKSWLEKRGKSFTDKARDFGLPQPKGLLLLGIQGCGKTLICKSIAGLWGLPLIKFDIGKVMHGIVGSSEENMRKVIKVAESISPCILFVDEIEKGLSGTGSSNFSDGGTTSRV